MPNEAENDSGNAQAIAESALAHEMDPGFVPAPPDPAKPSDTPTEKPPDGFKPAVAGEDKPGAAASEAGQESGDQAGGDEEGADGGDGDKPADKDKPVAKSAADRFKELLRDPELGPEAQSWADKSGAAQVKAALDQAGTQSQQHAQDANMEQWSNYFSAMSQEELGQALAESPDAARAYAAVQQYTAGRQQNLNSQQIATAAQVYSLTSQINIYNKLLEEADLPQDVRDTLKPESFTHLGPPGINAWGQAVTAALIKHGIQKATETEVNTRWEATKQERLAELDQDHPGAASSAGSPSPGNLDLISTPDDVLLENALVKRNRGGKS